MSYPKERLSLSHRCSPLLPAIGDKVAPECEFPVKGRGKCQMSRQSIAPGGDSNDWRTRPRTSQCPLVPLFPRESGVTLGLGLRPGWYWRRRGPLSRPPCGGMVPAATHGRRYDHTGSPEAPVSIIKLPVDYQIPVKPMAVDCSSVGM